jgi:hypothetical protein
MRTLHACVLNQCYPLVPALNRYPRDVGGGLSIQSHVWANVVMEDLHPRQNGAIFFLEVTRYLFSVSNFSIQSFHLVIVVRFCEGDIANVNNVVGLHVCTLLFQLIASASSHRAASIIKYDGLVLRTDKGANKVSN